MNADGRAVTRSEVTLSWSLDNTGPDLLNLMATVAGNLFELKPFSDFACLISSLPTIPGAALLTAHSEDEQVDGLQLALKGGQIGTPDSFGWIKQGGGNLP